ncbi:SOS response-associated peptidase [soil metagenome]
MLQPIFVLIMFQPMNATPFDSDAPLGSRRAIIRYNPDNAAELEMVELTWGLKPKEADGRPFRFVRSEGRTFPSHRCLIPASEFHVTTGERRYRFSLEDGNWFYLAGVWRPATDAWPESYAILTVEANPEVARYQERQGAVLLRRQRLDWLDQTVPESDLLQPLLARSLDVAQLGGAGAQPLLAL